MKKKTPKLYLAPMEGLGNYSFRNAIALIGGFDEATTEFISVPRNAHVKSLAKKYNADDTAPIAQAAQIMGSCPDKLSRITVELIKRGACRVELNVGCPSNTVTGKGSGSSLLKDPKHLHTILSKMVSVSTVPISAKLRTGYDDTSLFKENLLAAESAGISHLTLHGRTKAQGYKGYASLDLIAQAKQILSIPLVGNGDIKCAADAEKMLSYTGCDALMIGRGAVINPWIFHEIKGEAHREDFEITKRYLFKYFDNIQASPERTQAGQLKGLFSFMFQRTEELEALRRLMLRIKPSSPKAFLEECISMLEGSAACTL